MFHSEYRPQVGVGQREVWLQTNRLPAFCNGAVEIAFRQKCGTYVDVRFRESGIDTDRLPVRGYRSIQVTFDFQGKAYLIVCLGVARPLTESLPVFSYGAVQVILSHKRIASGHVRSAGIRCGGQGRNTQEERQSYYAQFHKARYEGRLYKTHVAIIKAAGNEQPFHRRLCAATDISRTSTPWRTLIEETGEHYGQFVVRYGANNMVPPAPRCRLSFGLRTRRVLVQTHPPKPGIIQSADMVWINSM